MTTLQGVGEKRKSQRLIDEFEVKKGWQQDAIAYTQQRYSARDHGNMPHFKTRLPIARGDTMQPSSYYMLAERVMLTDRSKILLSSSFCPSFEDACLCCFEVETHSYSHLEICWTQREK